MRRSDIVSCHHHSIILDERIVKLNNLHWKSLPLAMLLGSYSLLPSDENPKSACAKYAKSLQQIDAVEKASVDWLSGNKGFLGVYGYSTEFPPLDKMELAAREELLDSQGFEMVEGTTDNISDEGCLKFQTHARHYAERYNLKKLEFISKAGPSR
jgi:hypothetical protein